MDMKAQHEDSPVSPGSEFEPFYFIQAADTQLGLMEDFDPSLTGWGSEIELVKKSVEKVNKMVPKPRFYVVCGDLVHAWPLGTDGNTEEERQKHDKDRMQQIADWKDCYKDLDPSIRLMCVCGNHDIGNAPTPKSIAEYNKNFGRDYYTFWESGVKFIVLNSQFYVDSSKVEDLEQKHDDWLDKELFATDERWQHLVLFQHIPWFIEKPDEADFYFNITIEKRKEMLKKLNEAGVKYSFCGHYHRNGGGMAGDLEVVVTTAIGGQLGDDGHGMRVVKVEKDKLHHKFFNIDDLPEQLDEAMKR